MTPDRKLEIIESAIATCKGMDFANAQKIYDVVFDRKNEFGLAPLFDKATHLITSNKQIATESYNVNFIFKNSSDNDVYDNCYADIAMVLLYLHIVQIEIYSRMKEAKEKYLSWLIFTSIGSYEAIFKTGKSRMIGLVNSTFKDFLICPNCQLPIKLHKRDAAQFYIAERLDCRECGMSHSFPLAWLLSKLDVDFSVPPVTKAVSQPSR